VSARHAAAEGLVGGFLHNLVKHVKEDAGNTTGGSTSDWNSRTVLGSLGKEAKAVAGSISEEAHELKHAAWEGLKKDWVHDEAQNKLFGHSRTYNNTVLMVLVVVVALSAAAASSLERVCWPQGLRASGHPSGWVLGVLAASYGMLIPAIRSTLFSFNIFLDIKLGSFGSFGYNITRVPVTESMASVIGLLFRTGGRTGAYLVILYAMVMPALKLVLLVLGELWRNSEDALRQSVASACIVLVQVTSKWAAPDLFAYILLLFLFRHLHHPPLIQSTAVLDVGFACFGVFCLCSMLSTLAIHRPQVGKGGFNANEPRYAAVGQAPQKALLLRGGNMGALLVISIAVVAFTILLIAGIMTPCMALHLDTTILMKPKGPVPKSMKWVLDDALDSLKLRPLLDAEVNLWQCMASLAGWAADGEAASVMAFIMLALFAVALTALDMLMLLLATAAFSLGATGPNSAMAASRVLKHISMLDVFCMGVYVVCLAGKAYSSVGFNLYVRRGLAILALAEGVHYLTFHLVSSALGPGDDAASSDESSRASLGRPEDDGLHGNMKELKAFADH